MTLILTIEIHVHVLQKWAYLTYSAIKVVYTAFTLHLGSVAMITFHEFNIDCICCIIFYFFVLTSI